MGILEYGAVGLLIGVVIGLMKPRCMECGNSDLEKLCVYKQTVKYKCKHCGNVFKE